MDAMVQGRCQFAEDCDCAPEVEARESLPGVRKRQRIRAERSESAGADGWQAPLAATVYSLERLRCGACGQVFTAQEPEGVGPEKIRRDRGRDDRATQVRSGTPFYRLEQLQAQLGIPLPAATQMGSCRRGSGVTQTGARRVDPAGAQGE